MREATNLKKITDPASAEERARELIDRADRISRYDTPKRKPKKGLKK